MMGKLKHSVFPVPVAACSIQDAPESICAKEVIWIPLGVFIPFLARLLAKCSDMWMSPNFAASPEYLL